MSTVLRSAVRSAVRGVTRLGGILHVAVAGVSILTLGTGLLCGTLCAVLAADVAVMPVAAAAAAPGRYSIVPPCPASATAATAAARAPVTPTTPIVAQHPAQIDLVIGSTRVREWGVADTSPLPVAPVIEPPGRAFVPLRFVSEALGAQVSWNAELAQVSIALNGHTVVMAEGCTAYTVDGARHEMDARPFNEQGHIMVPIRFVAEALGATVMWSPPQPAHPAMPDPTPAHRARVVITPAP